MCEYQRSNSRAGAEEVEDEWGAGCFKKSKLAVNNRCNFGTFQICSSENQKIKRTQTAPVSDPSTPRPTLASITDNSTQAVAFYRVVCVCVCFCAVCLCWEGGRLIDRLQLLMQLATSWCKSTPSLKLHTVQSIQTPSPFVLLSIHPSIQQGMSRTQFNHKHMPFPHPQSF